MGTIATNGLKGAVVVDTADAVFISDIENSRDVKNIVTLLKQKGRRECYKHTTETHIWGHFQLLEENEKFNVFRLVIRPSKKFDQDFKHIASWNIYIFQGEARLWIDGGSRKLKSGDSQFATAPGHVSIENRGQKQLTAITTQAKKE